MGYAGHQIPVDEIFEQFMRHYDKETSGHFFEWAQSILADHSSEVQPQQKSAASRQTVRKSPRETILEKICKHSRVLVVCLLT